MFNDNLEILIDDDIFRREFYIYLINHNNKTFTKYVSNTIPDTIRFAIESYEKHNISKKIGTYLFKNTFRAFKETSLWCNQHIIYRHDIYEWRMRLPVDIRNKTDSIYYYVVSGYNPINYE